MSSSLCIVVRSLATLPLVFLSLAQAAYEAPESFLHPEHTVRVGAEGYSVDAVDDSPTFQKAIDTVHASGGGHVVVPSGDYRLMSVLLKSDVHVLFEPGVTIHAHLEAGDRKGGNIFNLGSEAGIQNASVVGAEDQTIFDFTNLHIKSRIRAVLVGDCQNFRVANLTFNDAETTFSSITLTWKGEREGVPLIPVDGLVENIVANHADYGYGAIQAHSGRNIHFRKIKSVGGVAVRLETGYKQMNEAQSGGLFDILVEDVMSEYGQAAVFLEPHTMRHGDVVLRNLQMEGSEFALYIANGFVSTKKYGKNSPLTVGHFKSISVDGVRAVFREGPNITRYVHLRYFPEELHDQVITVDSNTRYTHRGPSIAAVANMRVDEPRNISIKNVEAIGFKYHPDIITPKDLYQGSIKKFIK